ncbi:hypothetical protein [Achromobacter spanius]|uniref:hypothetical protein n=1 Tax=Achromobacter spanius TaxID=217203 RepID=UPI003A92E206
MKRSDTLLMLRIRDGQAYLIDTRPHSEENLFVNTRLLEIIDSNWPHLLVEAVHLTGEQFTPSVMKRLRSRSVMHALALKERTVFPNIVSAGGIPMDIQRQYDYLCIELENVERDVRQRFYEYFPFSIGALPTSPWIQHLKLVAIRGEFFTLVNQITRSRCLARRTTFRR